MQSEAETILQPVDAALIARALDERITLREQNEWMRQLHDDLVAALKVAENTLVVFRVRHGLRNEEEAALEQIRRALWSVDA